MACTGRADQTLQIFGNATSLSHGRSTTLAALYDAAFGQLSQHYRNEYVFKSAVLASFHGRTNFVDEFRVGASIVDMACVEGDSAVAYEIKTGLDSTRRLATQTNDYLRVFDKVYVVADPIWTSRCVHLLDSRVGIIMLLADGTLELNRPALSNRKRVDPSAVFSCMRRDEYMSAVAELAGMQPAMPSTLIYDHHESIFRNFSPDAAHGALVRALFGRCNEPRRLDFIQRLPPSLRAVGCATPLSGKQRGNLLNLLVQPLQQSSLFRS